MSLGRRFLLCGEAGILVSACQSAEPLPQVVLYVDTDLALVSELTEDLSPDSAIDTMRIEVLDSSRDVVDSRTLVLSVRSDLPFSLGLASEAAVNGVVTVRIRAFRALYAIPGEQQGMAVLDPLPETTVDRLVALALPDSGVEPRSVTLHGDCIGVRPQFGIAGQPDRTCVDSSAPDVPSSAGIVAAPLSSSATGTWALGRTLWCAQEPPAGKKCVPGGLSVLGDRTFFARNELEYDAVPLRVVHHSAFLLDETEVTVGELRVLVEQGYSGPMPDPPGAAGSNREHCTWDPGSGELLPLNCLSYEAADAICEARGGHVPSEAQWDHAARGRGRRFLYPWGNDVPACCTASVARIGGAGCTGRGPEPVASHLGNDDCPGDLSRDGVVDLAGSVIELMLDSVSLYTNDCWTAEGPLAVLHDPVCRSSSSRAARGGAFAMPFGDVAVPVRRAYIMSDHEYGVRCAYEALP